jgi:excisionase family DNA binding protein
VLASSDASHPKKHPSPDQGRDSITMSVTMYRKWYSTAEVAELLGYGLTKAKHLVLSGEIRSVKDGGHRKILPEWVDEYIRRKVEDEAA